MQIDNPHSNLYLGTRESYLVQDMRYEMLDTDDENKKTLAGIERSDLSVAGGASPSQGLMNT